MTSFIKVLVYISMFVVAFFMFVLIWRISGLFLKKKDDFVREMNRRDVDSGTMTSKMRSLSKNGVMYRLHNYDMKPSYYVMLRISVGVLFGALLFFLLGKFIYIPVGILAGYILTHLYFVYENKRDNEEMIMDIYNTYANLKIQMSAGVFIREVLEYTYKMMTNARYKEALGELVLNFSDKTVSTQDAIRIFKDRFNSREIDKLAALISSFMQYGLNSNHAGDIMIEIQSLIQADTLKAEHDIEMKASMTNFAFFAVIIVVIVFAVFSSFSSAALF